MFSSGERNVLKELGLTIITENEEGKRLTTKPTLFYLMHCGKALYNNLLWKNWSRETLPQLTIIGNSFSGIQDRMLEREFQRDYSYIAQAVVVCEERPLPCPSRLLDVFNDTVIISFPSTGLNKLPQCTWAEPPEPRYLHDFWFMNWGCKHCKNMKKDEKNVSLQSTPTIKSEGLALIRVFQG